MKILNIVYFHQNDSRDAMFINNLLSKNIANDYLFENNYFQIQMESTDYACLLYRIMWENMYLRRKGTMTGSWLRGENNIVITMSVSEAISFIYQATPPALQKNIKNELISIDIITSRLREILIETTEARGTDYYLSHFWQIMRFQEFENPWDFDLTKIKRLYKMNGNNLTCQVVSSTGKVEDMITEIPSDSLYNSLCCKTQLLFTTQESSDLIKILNYVKNHNLQILSINVEDNAFYIMTYLSEHNILNRADDYVNAVIHSSYNKIIK